MKPLLEITDLAFEIGWHSSRNFLQVLGLYRNRPRVKSQ
jgi:hypothetical protein